MSSEKARGGAERPAAAFGAARAVALGLLCLVVTVGAGETAAVAATAAVAETEIGAGDGAGVGVAALAAGGTVALTAAGAAASAAASAAAGAADGAAKGAPGVPRFDGRRAMVLLVRQCDLGPRPAGSPAIERLRKLIESEADSLGLRHVRLCFQMADPYGGPALNLCNLVVSAGPRGGSRLWLAAHYDTRPRSDLDPDPTRRDEPLLGANDGASGVAVLLHLAELMAARPPERGVDLLFLDGEDWGRSGDINGYCLGSRHLAKTWQQFGNPLSEGRPEGLVLLDMIGEAGLQVPMEAYSLQLAPAWTRKIFERAEALDLSGFITEPGPAVYDDHIPFLQAGIPAVDLIDFDFPQWHTTADTPAVCSAASLGQVGRLLVDLVYR